MDEVSFDFMDALDPGCAALFPSPTTVTLQPNLTMYRREIVHPSSCCWVHATTHPNTSCRYRQLAQPAVIRSADAVRGECHLLYSGNSPRNCPRSTKHASASIVTPTPRSSTREHRATLFPFLLPPALCLLVVRCAWRY